MNDHDGIEYDFPDEESWIGISVALALVLILMIGAFIWFVVQFDPLTSDFIDTESPTATATIATE
jgi:hypothetical protein